MAKSPTMLRRFFESTPWIMVSLALLAISLGGPLAGLTYIQIAALGGFVVFLGLLMSYRMFQKRSYLAVITPFRTWLRNYQRLIAVNEQYGPMSLMRRLMSKPPRDKTSKKVLNVLHERTTVIHQVLMDDLQNYIEAYDRLAEIDPSIYEIKTVIKKDVEELWRVVNRYHIDVIGILLRMKQTNPLKDATFLEDLSKFEMLYNEVLKEMKSASERANSELGIDLNVDVEKLLLAVTGR